MYWLTMLLVQIAPPPATEQLLDEGDARQMQMMARSRVPAAIEQARTLKPDALETALRNALTDRTRMIYREGHGVTVEYAAPGGTLHVWYPGGAQAAAGTWGVQRFKKKLVNACFRYQAADPAPRPFDPAECVPAEQTLGAADVVREWRGDVFGLATGQVPYVKSAMGLPEPR